jgi:cytochrome c peroxidase
MSPRRSIALLVAAALIPSCATTSSDDPGSDDEPAGSWTDDSGPPAGGDKGAIANPGFEQSPSLVGWTRTGNRPPVRSTVHYHGGKRSLRLGATTSGPDVAGDSTAWQQIVLPPGPAVLTLSFWTYAKTADADHDWQEAALQDDHGATVVRLLHAADDTRRWTQQQFDVSAFTGRTVRLAFTVHTDGTGGSTTLWVDDVGLDVQDGSVILDDDGDPPVSIVGQIFYRETRFAQYFWAHAGGDVNRALTAGDPVMARTQTTTGSFTGPYAGRSMNCAACHLIAEQASASGGGMRSYTDFARRSPIPDRGDGKTLTVRNSPTMVGPMRPHDSLFLHLDGEFTTAEDLVRATLTGRNFGWLPTEHDTAVQHIASVIRGDNGTGPLGLYTGGLSYAVLLAGKDPRIPPFIRLPGPYTIDVATATDVQILDALARLIGQYLANLRFLRNDLGLYIGSPYDQFLLKNQIPGKPLPGQTAADYTAQLTATIDGLTAPQFLDGSEGAFLLHGNQPFQFGPAELDGLKIFLGRGQCAGCHPPPELTDFAFHNTGAAQEEYDALHGAGAFAALAVPTLAQRRADPNRFLPASAAHPNALAIFKAIPTAADPSLTDLGLWNVFANDDLPLAQAPLTALLCPAGGCTPDTLLPRTIALFKTPGLRDLEDAPPFLHNGRADTIEAVVQHYIDMAALARAGKLRNADPRLASVDLAAADIAPLAAFLRSLTEDYTD